MRRDLRGVRLKYLNRVQYRGKVFTYFRPPGRKGVRLPDLPHDDPRFLAAYAEAAGVEPVAPVIEGSIAAAVRGYRASDAFRHGLAVSTRAARARVLDDIADRYGRGRISDLAQRHVRADLDRFSGHAANNRLRAWRGFLAWAVETYGLASDPSDGIRRKRVAASEGHVPWTPADCEKFRGRWPIGTDERLAFELIAWTGARVSDAIRLGWGHVTPDGWLSFRQSKTGGVVDIPFRRDLPEFAAAMAGELEALHAALEARPERHLTFITTRQGSARSHKAVSQWFAAKARAAGLTARTAHGLRKTRAIALVEAGATPHQVGAWTGHETLAEIEHYARRFDRRRALSATDGEQKSSKTSDQVPKRRKK